ncbi:MAG TPA: L,D-transpeptidase family protein [Acidimicrobiales bacterium]|nr:L,D-transpeptidase family protein [Acidimicrobiales bacterium]
MCVSLVLTACGSAERPPGGNTATAGSVPRAPTSTAVAAGTAPASTRPSPPSTAPATSTAPVAEVAALPTAPLPTAPVAGAPAQLDRAGAAGQAVVVAAPAYGSTTAELTTWQRAAGGWEAVHGPWPAHVGRAGFAPPGEKREGDGRTPSGAYGFEFAFGVQPDPGVALPYRRVTGPSIVWDDVPSSATYNMWVDGGVGESMYQSPAYDHGAVIAYNTARTPGLGSAIFLHVSTNGPTAGCVSLPAGQLVDVLRWLDPAQAPVIVMGVG